MNIVGNDIYITNMNVGKKLDTKDFVYLLQNMIESLKEFKENGLDITIENVHFPPVIDGLRYIPKDEYEAFLADLGCKDKKLTVRDLNSLDCDENYINAQMLDGKKLDFGVNYRQQYTEEQLKVLDEVNEFKFDLEDMMEEDEENNIKAFVAICQFKPEYSPKKMQLILDGQKKGLNTMYYEALNETEIEQLMKLQLEGFERKDYIDIIKSGKSISEARKELEIEEDELQQLTANNEQISEENNTDTKKALVERALTQQQTISEQQLEMNRLKSKNKEQ